MAQKMKNRLLDLIRGYCRIESIDMNIVQGIITIIYDYHKFATWSKKFKGKAIELSEDDIKASNFKIGHHDSVRADFSIERGEITSWELEIYQSRRYAHFYGVVCSGLENFDSCPYEKSIHGFRGAYGIDDWENGIYKGGRRNYVDWNRSLITKPQLPIQEVYKLKMVADWTDGVHCKLSIFYKDRKMNDGTDEYTLLLPKLDEKYVWYPCVSPYSRGAHCIIRYV